ncbi:phenylalanine--tRNA ligase subunit beta [Buchnera aphidicola]|uniref:Phenylalanine--tRNA ligase beta subunit n=1 Tax=Buchnera aphidicola (Stegophylla sp.) TaxID=2315800 RepID=A0A4D6YKW5_9GAMM|nr:phenylalanine--tRNA ligase subunit beta [Buchnera aphidicola (Stegophylla sp.)]QCI26278.1 phenylalanine--tRNA ligase subunit beta [Buchnera aphidicola (Stegophylla sp.)]
MRFSEKWLCDWINPLVNISNIYTQMTQSGLEVEEIKENISNNLYNVVIGEIISCSFHDTLQDYQILTINLGQIKKLIVICNKKKYQINTKVVVAKIGSILSNNVVINELKIGNVYSYGKICSFNDLGMFGGCKNIIEVPNNIKVGSNLYDCEFYRDHIFKMNILHNRMDALGILGIAREISILNNFELPKINHVNILQKTTDQFKINVKIDDIAFSYRTILIKNINLKVETPLWMKERLRKCHVDSVNIVVDILNYVRIELGQFFYVFNFLSQIDKISLEFCNIFNKKQYYYKNIVLNNKVIVFSSIGEILSVIGINNSDIFSINLDDTSLYIASFFIDLELLSNSLYHFKRSNPNFIINDYYVDPALQTKSINYISSLFLKICGGDSGPVVKYISKKYYTYIKVIRLYYQNIKRIVGYDINHNIVYNILDRLGYNIIRSNSQFYDLLPPTWRLDIKIEEDIISEIVRIYQYDNIVPIYFKVYDPVIKNNIAENVLKRAKYALVDKGYHEIISYSFVNVHMQRLMYPNKKYLSLLNPISRDLSCMRISLWIGLIKTFLYHQNRQYNEIKLFESGLCFSPNTKELLKVKQDLLLSGIMGSSINDKKHWDVSMKKMDFYDIKGDVEFLLESIGYLDDIHFGYKQIYGLHPHQSAVIYYKNVIIGSFGALHPILLKKFDIIGNVFLFEFFWKKMPFNYIINIKNFSDFPISIRDISILVDNNIFVGNLIQECKKKFLYDIVDIKIFDVYKGTGIPQGKKSVSLSLIFQNCYKTYKDQEVNDMTNTCMEILKKKFGAVLRK